MPEHRLESFGEIRVIFSLTRSYMCGRMKIHMDNITADIGDYSRRVETGRRVERKILDGLKHIGLNVLDASPDDDMRLGIDGYLVDTEGKKHSVQIKYRETGDDILLELIKDIAKGIPGRDMRSKAEYYLFVSREGTGKLFEMAPIKNIGDTLLLLFDKEQRTNPLKTLWGAGNKWEMKITTDRAHGQRKLMAYLSPSVFKAINVWEHLI